MKKSKYYILRVGPKEDTYQIDMKVEGNEIVGGFIRHYDKNWNTKSIAEIKLGLGRNNHLFRVSDTGYESLRETLEKKSIKIKNSENNIRRKKCRI